MMIVPLGAWYVAGWAGVLVTSLAKFGPSSLVTGLVLGVWRRFRDKPWRRVIQAGLIPMTVGLVAASAALIASASDRTVGLSAVTAVGVVLSLKTRLHPLWILAGGALAGLVGLAEV